MWAVKVRSFDVILLHHFRARWNRPVMFFPLFGRLACLRYRGWLEGCDGKQDVNCLQRPCDDVKKLLITCKLLQNGINLAPASWSSAFLSDPHRPTELFRWFFGLWFGEEKLWFETRAPIPLRVLNLRGKYFCFEFRLNKHGKRAMTSAGLSFLDATFRVSFTRCRENLFT